MRKLTTHGTEKRIHRRIMADVAARRGYENQQAIVWIGKMLRKAREAQGENQTVVAKRAGISQPELSRLENGLPVKGVTFTTLLAISSALDIDIVFEPHQKAAVADQPGMAAKDMQHVPHLVMRDMA